MAKLTNTVADITISPANGWHLAVPEMAELERASEAAHSLYNTTSDRLAAAQRQVQAGVTKRDALVQRTRAGEVVPGVEIAEAEIEIRAAESSAALLVEALPSLEAGVEAADRAILVLAAKTHGQMIANLRAAHQKAKDDVKAAEQRVNDTWRPLAAVSGYISGRPSSPAETDQAVGQYAPAALARIAAWRDRKTPKPERIEPTRRPSWAVPQAVTPSFMSANEILATRHGV